MVVRQHVEPPGPRVELVASPWSPRPPLGPLFQLALSDEGRGNSVARQVAGDQILWQPFLLELRGGVGVEDDEPRGSLRQARLAFRDRRTSARNSSSSLSDSQMSAFNWSASTSGRNTLRVCEASDAVALLLAASGRWVYTEILRHRDGVRTARSGSRAPDRGVNARTIRIWRRQHSPGVGEVTKALPYRRPCADVGQFGYPSGHSRDSLGRERVFRLPSSRLTARTLQRTVVGRRVG